MKRLPVSYGRLKADLFIRQELHNLPDIGNSPLPPGHPYDDAPGASPAAVSATDRAIFRF